MTIRRTKFGSQDLMKEALQLPSQLKPKSQKNKTSNVFGDTLGKIHMQKQQLNTMDLARMKAFKRKKNPNSKEPDSKKVKTTDNQEEEGEN
jgi:ribosome production factor 2